VGLSSVTVDCSPMQHYIHRLLKRSTVVKGSRHSRFKRILMSNKKEWVPGSSRLVKLPCTPLSLSQRDAAQPVVLEQSSVVFDRRRRRYHKHRAHIPDRMVLTG